MKVVLDTNVLISGIFWQGAPYQVLQLWAEQKFSVVATQSIKVNGRVKTCFQTCNACAIEPGNH